MVCRYEGEWRAALYDGAGGETFAKGSAYRGGYACGMREVRTGGDDHGGCTAFLRVRSAHQTSLHNTISWLQGAGSCRFFNGDYYEGAWSRGMREGLGMQQVKRLVVCG